MFFKRFWELVKGDILDMFSDFWEERLDIFFAKQRLDIKRLNYGVVTLVPKLKDANSIKQYRPICFLNVDFKWITRALTERLVPVASKIMGEN